MLVCFVVKFMVCEIHHNSANSLEGEQQQFVSFEIYFKVFDLSVIKVVEWLDIIFVKFL